MGVVCEPQGKETPNLLLLHEEEARLTERLTVGFRVSHLARRPRTNDSFPCMRDVKGTWARAQMEDDLLASGAALQRERDAMVAKGGV